MLHVGANLGLLLYGEVSVMFDPFNSRQIYLFKNTDNSIYRDVCILRIKDISKIEISVFKIDIVMSNICLKSKALSLSLLKNRKLYF